MASKKLRFQEIVDKFAIQLDDEERERLVRLYDLDPLYFQRSRVQVLNALRMLDVYSHDNPEGLLDVADVLERRDLVTRFSGEIQDVKQMTSLRRCSSSAGVNLSELYAHADLGPTLEISRDHLEIMKSHVKLMRKITAHRFAARPQRAKQIKKHLAAALEFLSDCAESLVQAGEEAGYPSKHEFPLTEHFPIGVSETSSPHQPCLTMDPNPLAVIYPAPVLEQDHILLPAPQEEEVTYANIGRRGLSFSHSDQNRPKPEQIMRSRLPASKRSSLMTHDRSLSVDSTHHPISVFALSSQDPQLSSSRSPASCSPVGSPTLKRKGPQPPPKPLKDTAAVPKSPKESTPQTPPPKPKQEASRVAMPPVPPPKPKPIGLADSPVQVIVSPPPATALSRRKHSRHSSIDLDHEGYATVLYPGKQDDSPQSTGDSGINTGDWPTPDFAKVKHEYQSLQPQTAADDNYYHNINLKK